ncbi:MAG: hypothetical protein IKY70_07105 [Bacteroidales bacterium]|nr:hypothetical protein [Bacteroidales bacterium]
MTNKIFIILSYIVATIIVFTSCNSGNVNPLAFIPPDLSKAKDADVIEITKIEKETTGYMSIAVRDSFIVASGSDLVYTQHLFSKTTGKYLKSFAAAGRGPGEFIMGWTSVHFTTGNDSTYYIVHLPMNTVYTYRTNEIMNRRSLPFKFTRLSSSPTKVLGQLSSRDIIPMNDKIIVNPSNKRKNNTIFRMYDKDGVLLDTFAVYPQIDEIRDKRLIIEGMFASLRIAVRPDCKRMVSATHCGAYMGIYSLENDSISLLKENRYHVPKLYIESASRPGAYGVESHEDNVTGFTDMTSSQERIYALYYGRKFSWKDNLYYIMEYDWNGNLLELYKINAHVFDLQYDMTDGRLYLLYGNYEEGDYRLGYMEI